MNHVSRIPLPRTSSAEPPPHVTIGYRVVEDCYVFESAELPGLFAAHEDFELGRKAATALATEVLRRTYGPDVRTDVRTLTTPTRDARRMLAHA